jgi:hypothetical protein
MFTKIGYIPGLRKHLKIFKIIKIIQCQLANHNGIKLKVIKRKIPGKS